ncbi:hypothetical protein A2617_04710 [Candidatus Daviesbacteria bacterium RIFOXYD1_FULL_41_10]|uniref:PIN domain-containing protein n=3 Tax=Patescibacteria group TaxID=1783273 RepID=A0A1F5N1Q7_9BACT|nr:MAG: hypothetical protein UU67_C0058G0005 [Candidatus Daviesbacteria bacterium GW2011_GWB1_41_5]KKT81593.1 MAG: hypothetical protein UW78_C0007G0015 [Candidatus Azambacteria bacterium GW2011_GWA1_44_9]OGE71558.1 MAG: hypothetical protein A2617_04710 [Candidatus Daviesbacteria bacterium RIFOXYD1_FULL_41_10]
MNKSIIIDASVVAKWLLPDEENLTANIIKKEFAKRDISISVPIFIFYEVNNLLKSAILSGRLDVKEAINLYEAFLDIDFIVYFSKQLLKSTLKEAVDLNISSYDASYIALAECLQIPFFTADEKLVKKAANKLVRSVEDY